jgi:hypothetical protein
VPGRDAGYAGIAGGELVGLGDSVGIDRGPLLGRILDSIIPVSIASKFYGEKAGSQFGITAAAPLDNHDRPCVEFFSIETDWAINRVNAWWPRQRTTDNPQNEAWWWYDIGLHMFTPDQSYNPIENHPTGVFRPNLVTNTPGNVGSVLGEGGGNSNTYPRGVGYILHWGSERCGLQDDSPSGIGTSNDSHDVPYQHQGTGQMLQFGQDKKCQNMIFDFDPPIRILRHRTIDFALFGPDWTFDEFNPGFDLVVSLMYTELPNPRGAYKT